MTHRPVRSTLLAGVALVSISSVATANGWDGFIVFGDRHLDTGQYVTSEAVFQQEGDEIGDGRLRNTNRVEGGGRGQVISQNVASALGFGVINPSQPQSFGEIPTPPEGNNYAATFYDSLDILNSIDGTTRTSTINFRNGDDTQSVAGVSRPGLLNDPDREGAAWNALVLIGSPTRDLRRTADVDFDLDGSVDIYNSGIVLNPAFRDALARQAATNIGTGVDALTDAGAGLVVVTNAFNVGATPEVNGDNAGLTQADAALQARETEAEIAENRALAAEAIAATAASNALAALATRDARQVALDAALDSTTATEDDVRALQTQLNTAQTVYDQSQDLADQQQASAQVARADADEVALTAFEIALRPQIDAGIADPTLIATTRTAATDAYNDELVRLLRLNNGNTVLVDQRALFDAVIADPERFGFSAEVDQANNCVSNSTLYPCETAGSNVDNTLFVNGVDLTEAGHQLAADQITALVTAPSAWGGVPRIGISSARGVSDAGRDQVSREQSWKAGVYPFATGVASRVKLSDNNGPAQHDAAYYSGVVGAKYVFANGIAIGAGVGYQDVDSPGDKSAFEYEGDAYFGTVFAGVNTGPFFGNVTATYGKVELDDLTRVSRIGAAAIRNTGDTEATVSGFTAEAGVRLVQYDIIRAGPIANVSHWRSELDGYRESGWDVTAVEFEDIEARSTRAGLGVFMEAGELVEGQGSLFRAKLLYGYEFEDERQTVTVTPLGANSVGSFSADGRGADKAPLEFGAEIVLGYGPVITTLGYDGLFGDVSDHRFRIGASMPF